MIICVCVQYISDKLDEIIDTIDTIDIDNDEFTSDDARKLATSPQLKETYAKIDMKTVESVYLFQLTDRYKLSVDYDKIPIELPAYTSHNKMVTHYIVVRTIDKKKNQHSLIIGGVESDTRLDNSSLIYFIHDLQKLRPKHLTIVVAETTHMFLARNLRITGGIIAEQRKSK